MRHLSKKGGIRQNRKIITHITMLTLALFLFCFVGVVFATSEGGEHGGEHGEAAHKGWVATDTYRVMNFAVLALALFFVLRKPIAQATDSRIKGIKEQLTELEAKKKDAEDQLSQYNKKLAELDKEAEKIIEEYIRQGNEARDRILKEAESASEKLEEQAKKNIENEFEKAKQQLQEEILEKALAKAEEIVKGSITMEDQDRLVDEYLQKLVA